MTYRSLLWFCCALFTSAIQAHHTLTVTSKWAEGFVSRTLKHQYFFTYHDNVQVQSSTFGLLNSTHLTIMLTPTQNDGKKKLSCTKMTAEKVHFIHKTHHLSANKMAFFPQKNKALFYGNVRCTHKTEEITNMHTHALSTCALLNTITKELTFFGSQVKTIIEKHDE